MLPRKRSRKMEEQSVSNQNPEMNERLFDVSKVEEKLKNVRTLSALTGPGGVFQEMFKPTIERLLKAEQEAHLGYEPYKKEGKSPENSRNGYSKKTLQTSTGPVQVDIPRDRKGTFEPQLVAKNQSFDPDLEGRIVGIMPAA